MVSLLVGWRTREGNKAAGCVDNSDIWSAEASPAKWQNERKSFGLALT